MVTKICLLCHNEQNIIVLKIHIFLAAGDKNFATLCNLCILWHFQSEKTIPDSGKDLYWSDLDHKIQVKQSKQTHKPIISTQNNKS
jgi:hypothetical protein